MRIHCIVNVEVCLVRSVKCSPSNGEAGHVSTDVPDVVVPRLLKTLKLIFAKWTFTSTPHFCTMTIIDHRYYPGIMDSILSGCTALALFRFRATCRLLRNRADAILFHHAVLELDESSPGKCKLSTPAGEVLPMHPELVQVLDLRDLGPNSQLNSLLERFTSVHTLRRYGSSCNLWLSCFPNLRTTIDAKANRDRTRYIYRGVRVSRHTARYVYHHEAATIADLRQWVNLRFMHPGAEHVLVYHDDGEADTAPSSQESLRPQPLPLFLATEIVRARGNVTIVGAETLRYPLPQGLCGFVVAMSEEEAAAMTWPLREHPRMVTMLEWLDELKAERREIEGLGWCMARDATPKPQSMNLVQWLAPAPPCPSYPDGRSSKITDGPRKPLQYFFHCCIHLLFLLIEAAVKNNSLRSNSLHKPLPNP